MSYSLKKQSAMQRGSAGEVVPQVLDLWSFGLHGRHRPRMSPCHPGVPVSVTYKAEGHEAICSKCFKVLVERNGTDQKWFVEESEHNRLVDEMWKFLD